MHAWAEVEHDLVYKPLQGQLSDEEYSILDELNGLVMAGEIALERLQKAGERRVAELGRVFANHYDLAAYLLDRAAPILTGAMPETLVGRVDVLYELLKAIDLARPEILQPYLAALTTDFERRPLAEQIIDQLLAEDPQRYETYEQLRAHVDQQEHIRSEPVQMAIGRFIATWIEVERLAHELISAHSIKGSHIIPTGRLLERLKILDPEEAREWDRIRRFRNYLVHGLEIPPVADIEDVRHRLDLIIRRLRKNRK